MFFNEKETSNGRNRFSKEFFRIVFRRNFTNLFPFVKDSDIEFYGKRSRDIGLTRDSAALLRLLAVVVLLLNLTSTKGL